jgi:NADH:ubiquinone oxidoreductase subunit 6 (subunit J)
MRANVIKAGALVLLALLFVLAILDVAWPEGDLDEISIEELGIALFGESDWTGYALIVFLVGLLILVAILGGVFLAKGESEEEKL